MRIDDYLYIDLWAEENMVLSGWIASEVQYIGEKLRRAVTIWWWISPKCDACIPKDIASDTILPFAL